MHNSLSSADPIDALRPISIGFQGLAETFIALGLPFDSPGASELNLRIAHTMYHSAIQASCDLVERFGVYEGFYGSPASRGDLQYNLWGVTPSSADYDWEALKAKVVSTGLCNSLLIAIMPTSEASEITGLNGSIAPISR